jgi:hypothetical protein
MLVHPADRKFVKWAIDRSVPCYYCHEPGLPDPCLKVHLGHVTVHVQRGRLLRLAAHADRGDLDAMFAELVDLFALCGRGDDISPAAHPDLARKLRVVLEEAPGISGV